MADQENVQIHIQEKTFTIPKQILISSSDYFRAMFSSNFREKSQESVNIQEIDPLAFQLVVEYVQFKSMKITESVENAVYALQCACLLQFCEVQKLCQEKIVPEINIINCLAIHKVASQFSCSRLAVAAMTCATWNCNIIFKLDSFLEEPLEDVCYFLRRPELNVHDKREFIVWETIYSWIMNDEEERKPHLLKLLTCIDYTNLKLGDIADMTNYDVVLDNVIVTEVLNLIKRGDINLININDTDISSLSCNNDVKIALKSLFCETESVKRICPVVPWFAAFEVVDDDISGKRLTNPTILCYDCKSNTVAELLPLTKLTANATFCVGFRVCSVGYCFYILGGQYQIGSNKWNNDVWSFDTVTKKWEIHESLPENRRNHMMCVVDSVIYLIGGYGKHRIALSSMDAYDTIERKWVTKLPKTPFNGSGACCAYNQTILVFVEDRLHTYNIVSKKWFSEKIHSTEPRSYVSAVCHNDFVYLLRSYSNEVYKTNPCEGINIKHFGSFKNNTDNVCIVNDTLFSFSVDDNLKNKPIKESVNIIEVIPLCEESQKENVLDSTQHNLSNENEVNEGEDTVMEEYDEDEPEYITVERFKSDVEANHSQHSRQELREDYLRRKMKHKRSLRTGSIESDDDLDNPSIQQQHIQIPQGDNMVLPGQQQMLMQLASNQGQQSDQSSQCFINYPQVCGNSYDQVGSSDLVPKQGIKIWDGRMAASGLSNIPFMTGSSCHGCSTLFKLDGS